MPSREYTCVACGDKFDHTETDQKHYAEQHYTDDPKRCKPCRAERRDASVREKTPRYKHLCCVCGEEILLIFEPVAGREAFCNEHFER